MNAISVVILSVNSKIAINCVPIIVAPDKYPVYTGPTGPTTALASLRPTDVVFKSPFTILTSIFAGFILLSINPVTII